MMEKKVTQQLTFDCFYYWIVLGRSTGIAVEWGCKKFILYRSFPLLCCLFVHRLTCDKRTPVLLVLELWWLNKTQSPAPFQPDQKSNQRWWKMYTSTQLSNQYPRVRCSFQTGSITKKWHFQDNSVHWHQRSILIQVNYREL